MRATRARAKPARLAPIRRLCLTSAAQQERPSVDPMEQALAEASAAAARGEVPVGAVVVAPDGRVLASAGNQVEADNDASAHAELLALRAAAAALGTPRLVGCDLFATL